MGRERRIHERFDVFAQVEIEAEDETIMLPLMNLSKGGALLDLRTATDANLGLGDEVSAFLDFGSDALGENLALSLEAEVVRFEENDGQTVGVAIRWTGGSAFAQTKLGEIVERLSAEDSQSRATPRV